MYDSHKHLQITTVEWDAFVDDFLQTLDKYEVPKTEQEELKAIVNSTRADIVVWECDPFKKLNQHEANSHCWFSTI